MNASAPQQRLPVVIRLLRGLSALVVIAMGFGVCAWLVGRVATDRWEWSQWLWWIPTPVALGAAVVAMLILLVRRWWLRGSWVAVVVAMCVTVLVGWYVALVEHRVLSGKRLDAPGVLVMHWNWTHTVPHRVDRHVDEVLRLEPDIAFMTDGQRLWRHKQERARLEPVWMIERVSVYTVVSRWPVTTARPIVSNGATQIAVVEIDTTEVFGRPTTYLLVNLPSELTIGRMEHMRNVREMLDSADLPAIDVAVGDFNVTRGSASLDVLLSGMHHAFEDGGHGYAASYHRPTPLFHIDHILLGETVMATNYELVDPGHGRHRLQLARIVVSGRPTSQPAAP